MATLDTTPKTSQETFKDLFGDMATYFGMKTSENVFNKYFYALNYYPKETLKDVFYKRIEFHKPFKSNFPSISEIKNECAVWLNDNPAIKQKLMRYDLIEDTDFPLTFIREAENIIRKTDDITKFMDYCDSVRMPQNDRDRVYHKIYYRFKRVKRKTDEGFIYYDLYKHHIDSQEWKFAHSGKDAIYKCVKPHTRKQLKGMGVDFGKQIPT